MNRKITFLYLLTLVAAGISAFLVLSYFVDWRPRYYLGISVLPSLAVLLMVAMRPSEKMVDFEAKGSYVVRTTLFRILPFVAGILSVGIVVAAHLMAQIQKDLWINAWPLLVIVSIVFVATQALIETELLTSAKDAALSQLTSQIGVVKEQESTLLEQIVNGVMVIDGEGVVTMINPAAEKILEIESSKATKALFETLLKPVAASPDIAMKEFHQQLLAMREPYVFEQKAITNSAGKDRTLSLTVTPILDNEKQVVKFILLFQDITDRAMLEKMRLDFISIASHELRTPLTSINGYLSMLLNLPTIQGEPRQYLERVTTSVHRLAKLVKNILNITRIEQNKLKMTFKSCNLYQICNDELTNLVPIAEQKQITIFGLAVKDAAWCVTADEDILREVLVNFVSNAIKYSKAMTEVHVAVKDLGSGLRVEVTDQGIGISENDIKNMFKQFYRVDSDLVQNEQGTGLGLYISKKYVENMGGQIGVESQLGSGSTFYFVLPKAASEQPKVAASPVVIMPAAPPVPPAAPIVPVPFALPVQPDVVAPIAAPVIPVTAALPALQNVQSSVALPEPLLLPVTILAPLSPPPSAAVIPASVTTITALDFAAQPAVVSPPPMMSPTVPTPVAPTLIAAPVVVPAAVTVIIPAAAPFVPSSVASPPTAAPMPPPPVLT